MSGLGYNPYRDSDGKFASGPGGAGEPKPDRPVSERRRAPGWPSSHPVYVANSTNIKDHVARTRFHAHRAEYFAHQAHIATSEEDRRKFMAKAAVSARKGEVTARRAARVSPGSLGAQRARALADRAHAHARGVAMTTPATPPTRSTSGQPWTPAHEAAFNAAASRSPRSSSSSPSAPVSPSPASALPHSPVSEKTHAAFRAIDEAKASPMASTAHRNFADPGDILTSRDRYTGLSKREGFEGTMKAMSGKAITVEEISHGFAVPDGFKAKLNSLTFDGNRSAGVQFKIENTTPFTTKSGRVLPPGQTVATLDRSFSSSASGMVVEHAYFFIDKDFQSAGLSDHVNGNALRNYEKWGVSKVKVSTAAVGRYAWSRMGFAFNNPENAVATVGKFIDDHPHLASRKSELMTIARDRASRQGTYGIAAWDLDGVNPSFSGSGPKMSKVRAGSMRFKDTYNEVDQRQEHGFHFGQAVLLSTHSYGWSGTLKINRRDEGYQHAVAKVKVVK